MRFKRRVLDEAETKGTKGVSERRIMEHKREHVYGPLTRDFRHVLLAGTQKRKVNQCRSTEAESLSYDKPASLGEL